MRSTVSPKPEVSIPLLLAVLVLGLAAAAGAQSPVPSFSKTFQPSTIGPGSISTLRFDIVNGGLGVRDLAFTDNLPAGMTVATPANASTTCIGGSVSAPAGGSVITFSGGDLAGGSSCSVSVNVTATVTGTNVSGDLTSSAGNSGSATATLTVDTGRPGFSKSFSPAAVFFGGRSTLIFTIDNSANPDSAINLNFTDNLPSGMTVADPANATKTCAGGLVTATPGSSIISYSFGGSSLATVAANSTCTISVDVIAGAIGALGNTTGELTSQPGPFGGLTRSSGRAGNVLTATVEQISLTKEFVDDPAAPGGTVTLRFTVRNLDRRDPASNISFTDDLDAVLSGLVATGLPAAVCGGTLSGSGFLTFSGGSLGIEESCTFDVTLSVPSAASAGSFTNTTSSITADVGGSSVVGDPATDLLFVDPVPLLTKTFLDDPVGAGDSIELEFTITNTSPDFEATDITFVDVFVEEIQTASMVPAGGFCGPDSTATFTPLIDSGTGSIPAQLVIADASLDPGASCTFSVILDVFFAAQTNTYFNTTSEITATIDGETVVGDPASDSFDMVAAPALLKEFTDDPAAPGGTVTLEFTLSHDENAPGDATGITFTDDLAATLSGLTATGLPMTDVCGIGSEIDGTTLLTFTGGTLSPGESCTIPVTLDVPATATPGPYPNTTSTVVASILGVSATGPPAEDDLRIAGLTLTKEFTDDPVIAGGTVTLEFTLANDSTLDATDVLFTDDLDAVIDNMTATGLPGPDPCAAATGSSLTAVSGGRLLIFEADLLPAGTSCTFSATLQVPAGTASDTYVNRTDLFSATFDGQVSAFDDATDELVVSSEFLLIEKEFIDDPASPGDPVTLQFSLTNLNATESVADVAFTDDLDAALSGLVATGTPFAACGGTVSGTSVISFSGGSLLAGETCVFNVTLIVPDTAPLGTFASNVTSAVTGTIGGLAVTGDPASDVLRIDFLVFSKSFDGPVEAGGTVVLTFSIENLDEESPDPELNFTDDLDALIPGLVATDTPKLDVCGEGSSLTGTSLLLFDDGILAPGGSCTFSVTLQVPAGTAADDYLNVTSDLLQGSTPSAAPATAVLTVFENLDDDDDGVLDGDDVCADTVIPEGVPTVRLGVNRFALVDDDFVFDTTPPNGNGPGLTFTTTDTAGCSCEQIIENLGLGNGHRKFGCSISAMREWVEFVSKSARDLRLYRWILDRSGKVSLPKP